MTKVYVSVPFSFTTSGESDFEIESAAALSAVTVAVAVTGVIPPPESVTVFVTVLPAESGAYPFAVVP